MQANSYYTPRRSQGFAVHHDTHDVFVLQVAGEKHWRVYDPLLELPLKHQRWSTSLGEPGPAVLELTLRAGDTLYLPRGWLHDALTSETDSLHVTVGVNVPHVGRRVPRRARRVRGRRRVPPVGARATASTAADLLDRLAERLDAEDVARRGARAASSTAGGRSSTASSRRCASSSRVTADTPLERRPTVIADLDGTTLSFEGKHVELPRARARASWRRSFDADGPFTAAELPGELDEEGRLVLVRRLIREGFLRRSAAGA